LNPPPVPIRFLEPAEAWRPDGVSPVEWAATPEGDRVACWMETHAGLAIETEGQNRGPWARYFLRGDEGLPYCAAALLRAIEACGASMPPGDPKKFGKRWGSYYPNRSVKAWEANAKRAGTWMGPAVPPWRGCLMFHATRRGSDAGPGRHIDIVTEYRAGERAISVIGANVGDTIKRRTFRLGHPQITGFGSIGPSVSTLRGAA